MGHISDISNKYERIRLRKVICPFCFQSFTDIFRHKCKIPVEEFKFDKEICSNELFCYILDESGAIDEKRNTVDLNKLDQKKYQQTFVKLLNRLQQNPTISFENVIKDKNFDDGTKTTEFISTLNKLKKNPNEIKSYSTSSKLPQLCPYCGNKYRRLFQHKCKEAPASFHYMDYIVADDFFDYIYKKANIWDSRGFLNLFRFDIVNYRYFFLKAFEILKMSRIPSLKLVKSKLDGISEKEIAKTSNISITDHLGTQKIESSQLNLEEEKIQVLAPKIKDATIENTKIDTQHFTKGENSETKIPGIQNEQAEQSEKIEKIVKQICPFCFTAHKSLQDHLCDGITDDIIFSETLGSDNAFFRRLYHELNALNRYGKVDQNRLNHRRYRQLFLKYYKSPITILTEQEKLKKIQNYQLEKELLQNEILKHEIILEDLEKANKNEHLNGEIENEVSLIQSYKNQLQIIIKEQNDNEELERKEKLLKKKRRDQLLLENAQRIAAIKEQEKLEKNRLLELELEKKRIIELKKFKQICPFCYNSVQKLSRHSCDFLPPDFAFNSLLNEVIFFKELYKQTNALSKNDVIDEMRLNRRIYHQSFLRIYNKLLQTQDTSLEASYADFQDHPIIYDLSQFNLQISTKIAEIGKIADSSLQTVEIPQICPYCFRITECLHGHKCDKMPEGFTFDILMYAATFVEDIYKEIGTLDSKKILNFYIFNRKQYKLQFLQEYKNIINKNSLSANKTDLIEQKPIAELKPVKVISDQIPSPKLERKKVAVQEKLYIIDNLKTNSAQVKQACPFCLNIYNNLEKHSCHKIPKDFPKDYVFNGTLFSDEFFILLYYEVQALQKNGAVDKYKLHPKKYYELFFKIYNILEKLEKPTLASALEEMYLDDLDVDLSTPLSDFDLELNREIQAKKEEKVKKLADLKFKQICPFCYELTDILANHSCLQLPEDYDSGFLFKTIPYPDEFFEELYKFSNGLNRYGNLDPVRLDQKKYTSRFLTNYNKLNITQILENSSDQNRITEKENQYTEDFNLDLGIAVDEEYSDLDLLELMSRDIDLGASIETKKEANPPRKVYESQDGMSLCFTCLHMVDCPKGLDSDQMENCLKCEYYENMEAASESTTSDAQENEMPLCFSCSNMLACPRNIDSQAMETIFSCKYYKDMNLEQENSEDQLVETTLGVKSNNTSSSSTLNAEENILESILARREEDQIEGDDRKRREEEEKKKRIEEIMKSWEQSKGELKVFCKKCEAEMSKVVAVKKSYYRCSNYPECLIKGEVWYVNQAKEKRVTTQKIHGDLLLLYQYDETKNIVFISEIFSEGKLFL